jgi:hypothetical protein
MPWWVLESQAAYRPGGIIMDKALKLAQVLVWPAVLLVLLIRRTSVLAWPAGDTNGPLGVPFGQQDIRRSRWEKSISLVK